MILSFKFETRNLCSIFDFIGLNQNVNDAVQTEEHTLDLVILN